MAVRSTWRRELLLTLALAAPAEAQRADRWREDRRRMVAEELVPQGITDSLTLAVWIGAAMVGLVLGLVIAFARMTNPLLIGATRDVRSGVFSLFALRNSETTEAR